MRLATSPESILILESLILISSTTLFIVFHPLNMEQQECRIRQESFEFIIITEGMARAFMEPDGRKRTRGGTALLVSILVGVLILAFLIGFSDLNRLLEIAGHIRLRWVLASLLSSLGALGMASCSFLLILRAEIKNIGKGEVFKIGYASFAFNHLFSSWGISGYAVRGYLLFSSRVSYAETLLFTLIHAVIHYVALFILYLTAVLFFLPSLPPGIGKAAVTVQLVVFFLILLYAFRFFRSRTARERWVKAISYVLNRFSSFLGKGAFASREGMTSFIEILEKGISSLSSKKKRLLPPFFTELPAVGFGYLALYTAFRACGYDMDAGVLVSGYIIGSFWIAFFFLPGRLGVLEGSVSGVYALFGVPVEIAIAALVVYRISYYLFPFLLAFLFLPSLMRKAFSAGFGGGN